MLSILCSYVTLRKEFLIKLKIMFNINKNTIIFIM